MAKWLDKYETLDVAHHPNLDMAAAIHEFKGKLPRAQAEAKAHKEYLDNHAIDSAAHHYMGMSLGKIAGNDQAVSRHYAGYNAALNHLGANANGAPPNEVLERIKSPTNQYKFKKHGADALFQLSAQESLGKSIDALVNLTVPRS